VTRVAREAPDALIRAVRYFGLVRTSHFPRRAELEQAAVEGGAVAELCRVLDLFAVAHRERVAAVDAQKAQRAQLSVFALLIYASLYAFDVLVPRDFIQEARSSSSLRSSLATLPPNKAPILSSSKLFRASRSPISDHDANLVGDDGVPVHFGLLGVDRHDEAVSRRKRVTLECRSRTPPSSRWIDGNESPARQVRRRALPDIPMKRPTVTLPLPQVPIRVFRVHRIAFDFALGGGVHSCDEVIRRRVERPLDVEPEAVRRIVELR